MKFIETLINNFIYKESKSKMKNLSKQSQINLIKVLIGIYQYNLDAVDDYTLLEFIEKRMKKDKKIYDKITIEDVKKLIALM